MKPTDRLVAINVDPDRGRVFDCRNTLRAIARIVPAAKLTGVEDHGTSHDLPCHVTRYSVLADWNGAERNLTLEAMLSAGSHRPVTRINVRDHAGSHVTSIRSPLRIDQANLIRPGEPSHHLLDFIEQSMAQIDQTFSPYEWETDEKPVTFGTLSTDIIDDLAAIIHAHPGRVDVGPNDLFGIVFAKPFGLLKLARYRVGEGMEVETSLLAPELAQRFNDALPEIVSISTMDTASLRAFGIGMMDHSPFRLPDPTSPMEAMKRLARYADLTPEQLLSAGPSVPALAA